MKRTTALLAALAAAGALAGCSTAAKTTSTATTTSRAVAASTTVASSPSTKPLSFYAAQYSRIVAPANAAIDKLKAMPSTATDADVAAVAASIVPVVQKVDAELLRAQWPPNVLTDIKAMVAADGPLLGDLNNLSAANMDAAIRESGAANAAANIVRADLNLPPQS